MSTSPQCAATALLAVGGIEHEQVEATWTVRVQLRRPEIGKPRSTSSIIAEDSGSNICAACFCFIFLLELRHARALAHRAHSSSSPTNLTLEPVCNQASFSIFLRPKVHFEVLGTGISLCSRHTRLLRLCAAPTAVKPLLHRAYPDRI